MTEINTEKTAIICPCSGTTRNKVIDLFNNGYETLEKISQMTGATTGCGACETWIEELLVEVEGKTMR